MVAWLMSCSIMEKLQEIGWDDEVKLMNAATLVKFKDLPKVNQARPITDHSK